MKKILLTGGTSYLARNLVGYLHETFDIYLLTRSGPNDCHCKYVSFQSLNDIPSIIEDIAPDIIIHTACVYGRSNETLSEHYSVNLNLGLILLQSLMKTNVGCKFINCGTSLPVHTNNYSYTKNLFSFCAREIINYNQKLEIVELELEHFYGPMDSNSKFPTMLIRNLIAQVPKIDLTSGNASRNFIHVSDVCTAISILTNTDFTPSRYQKYTIGSDRDIKISNLAKILKKLTCSKTILNFGALPDRIGENYRVRKHIPIKGPPGWKPTMPLITGLKKMVDDHKSV